PEFERGLMANLVARRCAVLERREDRQLIWFIQLISHQTGVKKLATDLMTRYPERVATPSMQKYGMKQGQIYSSGQADAVRHEIDFGEIDGDDFDAAELLSDSDNNIR